MTPKAFADAINAYATALGKFGAPAPKQRLAQFAATIRKCKVKSVHAALSEVAFNADPRMHGDTVELLHDDLENLYLSVGKIANKPFRDAVSASSTLLAKHSGMGLESFLAELETALRPKPPLPKGLEIKAGESRTDAYARALDAAVHEPDRFPVIFEALKNDPEMKRDQVVAIANQIVFKMPAKTTRQAALDRIWKRHETSETAAMKARAIGGKSAA